jgi:hypothetical protein
VSADGVPDPEDAKLGTLARSARVRTGAREGAAVRDRIGRTYSAATVDLAGLQLSALQAAVAAAVSSGAEGIEAAAVDGAAVLDGRDRDLLDELGVGTVLVAGPESDPIQP